MQLLKIVLLFILLIELGQAQNVQLDSNQVLIEGQIYKTVTIGNQTWLAENLNVYNDGSSCYENKGYNCAKYGRLYSWKAALAVARRISGWHLPTQAEWDELCEAVGGSFKDNNYGGYYPNIGAKLKKDGSSGFNALLAGRRYGEGYFKNLGTNGNFWSASLNGNSYAWGRYLSASNTSVDRGYSNRTYRFSVRLVKD